MVKGWYYDDECVKNDESFISKKMFDFMTQPTRLNNDKIIENYGGQWWLNTNNRN